MKKISLIASLLLIGSFFIGLGGSSSTAFTTNKIVTIEGKVVDDLIANGIVEICDQNDNLLKTIRTDENGTYKVTSKPIKE